MSGSVTDSDACGTDWEKWIPQIDSAKGNCNFSWRPPWKNFRIKLCSKDNKVLDNTSGYLVPLKMQFLMTHHLATIQKIIRNLESSTVESINATEELLEIKVKSLECEDIFTEIDRVLAREIDDIVMKPIQRLEFTSNLVEELFDQELKEKSIDLMRDETNIFIVGFEKMKSFITKNIDEINRVTVSKVVKLGDKWKIEAVRCFEIVETLSRTFTDVVVRFQEDSHCVYLKGRDVTISKAEKEVHKLFSDLFNEKLRVDPLILKLLICKEASELFKEVLQKDNLQVVWTVDQSHLYFVSKTQIDTDALTAVVYRTFLTTGFCKSSQYKNQFCNSNVFTKITKQHTNKLLFLETTKTSVNIAGTKSLIILLLHQEQIFYNKAGNTKEIQVDTLSYEVAGIKDEKMKVDLQMRELEVKLITETQKNKKANDQYLSLIRKCREEEEKFKRIIHEKELLLNESKDEKANLTKQLADNKTAPVDDFDQSIKMIKVSNIPTGSSEDSIRFFFEQKRKSGGGDIEDLDYEEDSHTAIITFKEDDGALSNGRVRCPWHGACFNVKTGDIEDFPGLDSLPKFDVTVADGKVKVKGDKALLTSSKVQKSMCKHSADNQKSVLIIGGGPASVMCAETLRKEGFTGKITIATQERHLPYDRTKLSKAMDSSADAIALRNADFYKTNGIDILNNKKATSVDSQAKIVKFEDESSLNYTSLVIATGGKPRQLPINGADFENVCILRTPDDANKIAEAAKGKKVVIIGSSFIGMEVAAFLADKAESVSVVDIIKVPFQLVLGDKVGSVLQKLHEDQGVKFYFEKGIKEFTGNDNRATEAVLSDDTKLPCDLAILCVGVVPATEFLKDSDITMTNRGFIPVDKNMKTNIDGIYAAGDIVEFPLFTAGDQQVNVQHWQMAHAHGKAAALGILEKNEDVKSVPFFWTMMYKKSIRYTGYGFGYDDIVVHGDLDAPNFTAFYTKGVEVVAVATLGTDPVAAQVAEIMYAGQKILKAEIQDSVDAVVEKFAKL